MNLTEALESGKRYNRAIKQDHWVKGVYLYDKEGRIFIMSPNPKPPSVLDNPYEFTTECLTGYDWILTDEAPWSGPAGVITEQRAMEIAAQCWCQKETEKVAMIPELAKAFADAIMMLGNSTIAFTETEPETYQGRVIKERHDLDMKRNKLALFLGTPQFKELSAEEKNLLTKQSTAMMEYSEILRQTIEILQQ